MGAGGYDRSSVSRDQCAFFVFAEEERLRRKQAENQARIEQALEQQRETERLQSEYENLKKRLDYARMELENLRERRAEKMQWLDQNIGTNDPLLTRFFEIVAAFDCGERVLLDWIAKKEVELAAVKRD